MVAITVSVGRDFLMALLGGVPMVYLWEEEETFLLPKESHDESAFEQPVPAERLCTTPSC